jgi:ankyrin repeat protein
MIMIKNYILLICCLLFQIASSQELNVFDVARRGTLEQAKTLYKQDPKIFNTVNDAGYSPLLLACYRGNLEVARFLIETGTDINAGSSMGTPLMAAVVKGNIEIVKALLDKKADVNASDANGITALIYAVQFQNPEILRLLLEHKADKAHKDKEGKTAFEHAVFSGNESIINLFK